MRHELKGAERRAPQSWWKYQIATLFVALLGLRLFALIQLPLVGDEPNDLGVIFGDLDGLLSFFSSPWMYELDQSRLQFFASYPVLLLFGYQSPVPLRLFFLIFHLAYLFVSYQLARELVGNPGRAIAFPLTLVASCYVASFSIFYITTSDNLFLLLHLITMYAYIRSVKHQRAAGEFPIYIALASVVGLMVASKLFGVLLLAALFAHHALTSRGPITIRSVPPSRLMGFGIAFLTLLAVINLAPLSPLTQTLAAVGLAMAYAAAIGILVWKEWRRRFASHETSFLGFWIGLTTTSFCLTLVFSPVYLNLGNLRRILEWFRIWPQGLLVAEWHIYDILVIILMKLGMVSTLLMAAIVLIYLWSLRALPPVEKQYFGGFFVVVFLIQFTVNSLSKFHVAWYPLAIFPLIFLFAVCTWDRLATAGRARGHRRMAMLVAACLSLMMIDNIARQIRWFPYGHFDGAQYGREYVSWNRAGFVTFESIKPLFEYLGEAGPLATGIVDVKMIAVPEYNQYAVTYFDEYAKIQGLEGFTFTDLETDAEPPDYLLTSPIYNPGLEARLESETRSRYRRVETIALKGIEMATVWRPILSPVPTDQGSR